MRLWCLTIPIPKISPIIVAALPIPDSISAAQLLDLHLKVLDGLLNQQIQVVSYACDGTEVERSVQRLFLNHSTNASYSITNPLPGGPDTVVMFAVYRKQPIVMIQDSKHALKTFRNNLFSGARLLVFGNHASLYHHIREVAFEDGSPLFHRDVDNIDRQDDNAASRLFSADMLNYLANHHPDYVGEIVYLFVFGELIDAYQNRRIPHVERVKMVLRAHYFLDSWEAFLNHCGYPKTRYFLSREAADIARIVIEGYLSLIIIHRDHVSMLSPLLPWLHSSETCEHVFGEARQIVKDFTYLDLIYMIPKLRIKIREAVLRATSSNPKARAAGYNHTYFEHTDVDMLALSTFPSDPEIQTIAQEASEEVTSLVALLGIVRKQLYRPHTILNSTLPTINSWLKHVEEDVQEIMSDSDNNRESDEEPSEAQQLQSIIDAEEFRTEFMYHKREEQLQNLTSVALAALTDDVIRVYMTQFIFVKCVVVKSLVLDKQWLMLTMAQKNGLPSMKVKK